MTIKQTMSLRQLCDATEMLRLQETKPFSMTDISVEGSALRAEFSDRVDCPKKRKRGQLFETSEVRFDCGSDDMARRWQNALNGGQKLAVADFAITEKPSADITAQSAPAFLKMESAKSRQPVLIDAKIIFNAKTGENDTVRLRFTSDRDGTIPYEIVPCESPAAAKGKLQKYKEAVQKNTALIAHL